MDNKNEFPDFAGSSNERSRLPEAATERIPTNDQNIENTILSIPNDSNQIYPIEMGVPQPVEGIIQPDFVYDDQSAEFNEHQQQLFDPMPYPPTPPELFIDEDYRPPFSPEPEVVPIHENILDGNNESIPEPVPHQDDDGHTDVIERPTAESVENLTLNTALHNEIHHVLQELIDAIDHTEDENEDVDHVAMHSADVVSPVETDLSTKDEDEEEVDRHEQRHESSNDSPDEPITERSASVTVSSSEAADGNPYYSTTTDNHHQTMEFIAQLEVPSSLSRKRIISLDQTTTDHENIKRSRRSSS